LTMSLIALNHSTEGNVGMMSSNTEARIVRVRA